VVLQCGMCLYVTIKLLYCCGAVAVDMQNSFQNSCVPGVIKFTIASCGTIQVLC